MSSEKCLFLRKIALLVPHPNNFLIALYNLKLFILIAILLMLFLLMLFLLISGVTFREIDRYGFRKIGQEINERFNWHKPCLKSHKNMTFVGYCLIISMKEYVKLLHVQSKFWKNLMVPVTARGVLDASIRSKRKQREKE